MNTAAATAAPASSGLACAAAESAVLETLGLEPADAHRVHRALQQPLGLILVAGPRQSGRSTTLSALLRALPAPLPVGAPPPARPPTERPPDTRCLVLDPAPSPATLRHAVETIGAGRRVFASVALERAAHVFNHYRTRGLAPAALARDLLLVIAQQRVHRLCSQCREHDRSAELRGVLAQAANSWLEGTAITPCSARAGGCAHCGGTGYRGSALVYELLPIDAGARALVESGAIGLDMEHALFADGRSLWDQGLRLLARGITALAALRAAVREPC
jgi:type II secretory ATPase GspE/PulE/Tfp pilus assembly ATPase PilB-like protein